MAGRVASPVNQLFSQLLVLLLLSWRQIDNISTCLRLLTALSIPLDDVTAADIHQGNLKSVLTVFFALSRYKQQQKQQQQQQQEMAKYAYSYPQNLLPGAFQVERDDC